MKKALKIILSVIICAAILVCAGIGIFYLTYTPEITVDFSNLGDSLSGGATGFLYGFSEPDIPSEEIAESIDVSVIAQKTYGGLQHPIGDINQVADTFIKAGGDNIIVYTQDMYSTWYYELDSMPEYLEKVRKTVTDTEAASYADKVTYCIFNEANNGQWFGDFSNYENRVKFYEAWKDTYNLVKSINPKAKIGGPGYYDFNEEQLREFLQYCTQNACVPEVVIWHELGDNSLYFWNEHFDIYRSMCKELNLNEMPVNISEYGLMKTNGIPGESVKWINRIESTDCTACVAYWRLANNLSDTVADDVMPNSNWWAYRWYSEMTGKQARTESKDILQANVGKYLTGKSDELKSKGFDGIATIDEDNGKIQLLVGGTDRDAEIELKNLDKTKSYDGQWKNVNVKIESVDFKGLSGAVTHSDIKDYYKDSVSRGKLKIDLKDILYSQAYLITITPADETEDFDYSALALPVQRYEAEDAKTFGTAKATKDVAYAASHYEMVKADSEKQSGVEFTVDVEHGKYRFDLIYGNGANGITYSKDGQAENKGERTNITAFVKIDNDDPFEIVLQNTIKDDFTNCATFYTPDILTAGKHKIRIYIEQNKDINNTVSFDFLDISAVTADIGVFSLMNDKDRTTNNSTAFIAIAPTEGYYAVQFNCTSGKPTTVKVNSADVGNCNFTQTDKSYESILYLRRGISYIEINAKSDKGYFYKCGENTIGHTVRLNSTDAVLQDNAMLRDDSNAASGKYIDCITSEYPSSALFNVNCDNAGVYQLTFCYSDNEEGGAHDYNVDLVERYITLNINNNPFGNVYFRNTQSDMTYKTKTITVNLNKGNNTILLSNDGSYKFNGKQTFTPHIDYIEVSPITIND